MARARRGRCEARRSKARPGQGRQRMAIEGKTSQGEAWREAWRGDAKPSVWRRIEGGSEGEAEIRLWRRLGEGKRRLRRGRVEAEANHRRDRSEEEAWPRRDRGNSDARPRRGEAISMPRPSPMRRRVVAEVRPREGGGKRGREMARRGRDKAEANVGERWRGRARRVQGRAGIAWQLKASQGEARRFAWRDDSKPSVWRLNEGGSEGEVEIRRWRRLGEGKRRLRRGRVEAEAKHTRDRSEDEAWPRRDRGENDARTRQGDIKAEAESKARARRGRGEAEIRRRQM